MPLIKGSSKDDIRRNIKMESNKVPRKQAVAIALNVAKKSGYKPKSKKKGMKK